LQFKNNVLEEKLDNKFKNGHEKFMVLEYPSKKSQNNGNPYTWTIFMPIFEFVGQFFFQNDVHKLQEDFSEVGIRVFLENGLASLQTFLTLQTCDKPEVILKIPKTVLKTRRKTKETTFALFFGKSLVVPIRSHSIR
jgi:hypothetical protein